MLHTNQPLFYCVQSLVTHLTLLFLIKQQKIIVFFPNVHIYIQIADTINMY